MTIDMDSILKAGQWEQWRERHRTEPEILSEGARAWSASSYWTSYTPRLEAWKIVVKDMGWRRLTENQLLEMAGRNQRRLPFPAIPLFEHEQVQDLCGILQNVEAAVTLAERLEANGLLLTVDPAAAAHICWESLPSDTRMGLDFYAWIWMFSSREPGVRLPSTEAVANLKRIRTPRGDAAIRRLEEVVRNGPSRGYPAESVRAVANALSYGIPPVVRQTPEQPPSGGGRNERLARDLFESFQSEGYWEQVQEEAVARRPGAVRPHPLVEMARHLREHEFSIQMSVHRDEEAWKTLANIFREYPRLLAVDGAHPNSPLPALDLACVVRSTVAPGLIASGLLQFAGPFLRSEVWWRAVCLALRPAPRRGGWRNADDKWKTSIEVLKQRRNLDELEDSAMRAGLSIGESASAQ